LKLTRLLLSLLVLIILFSFIVTLVHQTKIPNFSGFSSATINPLTIPTPLSLRATFFDNIFPLNQSTRLEVYNFVKANPGVHFRGICSGLGISIGVAQYHLGVLTKTGLISFFQDERYKRYFNSKSFGTKEIQVISVLRHKTAGKILRILSEKRSIAHSDLASKLEISSQALSWQMRRLRKMDIVDSVTESMKVNYSINEENAMMIKWCIDAIPARKI
jgi:predicted transcriptional regulator